jgi:hypothetical protein
LNLLHLLQITPPGLPCRDVEATVAEAPLLVAAPITVVDAPLLATVAMAPTSTMVLLPPPGLHVSFVA